MKKSRFIIQPVGVKDDTSSIVVNDVGSDTVTSSSASPHNMATPDATLHQQPLGHLGPHLEAGSVQGVGANLDTHLVK